MPEGNPAQSDASRDIRAGYWQPGSGPVQEQDGPAYRRIPLESLCLDTVTDFNIYLRVPNSETFVLYRDANLVFDETHRAKLRKSNVHDVYIATGDRERYVHYLEQHIDTLTRDPAIPPARKSEIVYECSSHIVQEVFAKPELGQNIRRAQQLVSSTVDHLLRGKDHLKGMIDIMSFDYYTYTHSVNVSVFGIALGQRLGLCSAELQELGSGLLLHDVGKSSIGPEILNKPGPLTAAEWATMKTHPTRGAQILQRSGELSAASLAVVLEHHEKCTGSGYPRGLAAHEIHFFAKIASLADVFDALTTDRPYRRALESFSALRVMQDEMRTDFNTQLFRELILLLSDRGGQDLLAEDIAAAERRARGGEAQELDAA